MKANLDHSLFGISAQAQVAVFCMRTQQRLVQDLGSTGLTQVLSDPKRGSAMFPWLRNTRLDSGHRCAAPADRSPVRRALYSIVLPHCWEHYTLTILELRCVALLCYSARKACTVFQDKKPIQYVQRWLWAQENGAGVLYAWTTPGRMVKEYHAARLQQCFIGCVLQTHADIAVAGSYPLWLFLQNHHGGC